ncbi:MAG: DNA polymerase III subunit gamma/tau [Eggerthellaceae bacterium]|nr:DNA polymerase III subunit gamma/tau [Eggerthellaceae bacterium]
MEALYRKYRPTTFKDVVGQEHIERTLKNAIEQGKVSHAYLFCGPRGTGKTTMARILAKALLCERGPTVEPDGTCPECEAIAQGTHPDVYELDAASRTGVDNVREEIIARVNYAPTRGAWKVYIIDEVHMLTNAAFNALLKTLEEPPEHILFILCTTDPQKVPDTIQSRCQRFDFHRISNEAIVSRLGAICVEEGVDFEGEALDLIAYRADGGMRNALTSLEQLIAFGGGHVTLEGAQNLLGSLDETDLSEIVLAIGKRDAAACFNWVARYVETGADLAQFVSDLSEYVRNMYLLSMAGIEVEISVNEATRKAMVDQLKYFGQDRLSRLLVVLGDLSKELHSSSNPRLSFEIALTRMVRPESDLTIEALAERIEELERKIASGQVGAAVQVSTPPLQAAPQAMPQQANFQDSPQQVSSLQANSQPVATAPVQENPPQSAPQGGMSSGVESVPPTQTSAASGALPIEVTNPASVQRFWHSVTSSLRKANPARGVLFMNAKIFGESNGSGLVITFGKDNGFAYTAAQKPEVQQLLSQTIDSIAGGHVPYRLMLEEGGSPQSPFANSAAASNSSSMGNSQVNVSQAAQPNQMAPQAERVRAAIKAAQAAQSAAGSGQAATQNFQAPQPSPQPANQAPIAQPMATQPSPQPASQALQSQPTSQASQPSAQPQVAPSAPAAQPQARVQAQAQSQAYPYETAPISVSSYEEERVPLEAYGDAFAAEEDPSYAAIVSDSPTGSMKEEVSLPSAVDQPNVGQENKPAPQPSMQPIEGNDESVQIKTILTNSFGEGIKFEELSE